MPDIYYMPGLLPLHANKDAQLVPLALGNFNATSGVFTIATGITGPTVQISKNGGAYAAPSDGTFAEVGNGLYTLRLNSTDSDTIGWVEGRIVKAANADETRFIVTIGIDPAEEVGMSTRIRRLHRERL